MATAIPTKKRNPGGGRKKKPAAKLPPAKPDGVGNRLGLRAAIERLHKAEIAAARDYEAARATGDQSLIAACKKNWLDLAEQLRKVEVSNPAVQQANSESLSVAEVQRETARMCNAFRVALESLPRSLPQRLVGMDMATIQETLADGIAQALSHLHTGKWAEEASA